MTARSIVSLSLVLFTFYCFTQVSCDTYYVTPSFSVPCPNGTSPCFTLSQYANQSRNSFSSNVTLVFIPGQHHLQMNFLLAGPKIHVFSMLAVGNSEINCQNTSHFHLKSINQITWKWLTFVGCERNTIMSVPQTVINSCTFINSSHSQTLSVHKGELMIQDSVIASNEYSFAACGIVVCYNSNVTFQNTVVSNNVAVPTNDSGRGYSCSRDSDYGDENSGLIWGSECNVTILNSSFTNNQIDAALSVFGVKLLLEETTLSNNVGPENPFHFSTLMLTEYTNVNIQNCTIENNNVDTIIHASGSGHVHVSVQNTILRDNSAIVHQTTMFTFSGDPDGNIVVSVNHGTFHNNSYGCLIATVEATAVVAKSHFSHNTLMTSQGLGNVIAIATHSVVSLEHCTLSHNEGGMISSENSDITVSKTMFAANTGTFSVITSNVTINDHTVFKNNRNSGSYDFTQQGGAMTCFQSEITFYGNGNTFNRNRAIFGGAIMATECNINIQGNLFISHNSANHSGGGIYAMQSILNIKGLDIFITNNDAGLYGGGIYAAGSTLKLQEGYVQLLKNKANRGGGCYLELNAKLYVIKDPIRASLSLLYYEFDHNSADFGGAIYVVDETNSGVCQSNTSLPTHIESFECFFQVISSSFNYRSVVVNVRNIFFTKNTGRLAGSTLYGGLLDRCTANPLAQVARLTNQSSLVGLSYIHNVSNIKMSSISSKPVRICFCRNGNPDCDYYPSVSALKGHNFTIPAVAVDQINNTIATTIHSYLSKNNSVNEGPVTQSSAITCTNLVYNILSPHPYEEVFLYAEGPCKDIGYSKKSFKLTFLPCKCPLGFRRTQAHSNCKCECDSQLLPYINNCSISDQAVIRKSDSWISYFNETNNSGFIVYPHCPFDYCVSSTTQTLVDYNTPDGADAQCAFNRSGILCGSCKDDLSLMLGSSRCGTCNSNWILLLIPFIVAGVVLVTFILVCNMTVAVGTINGLVFYANVVFANRAVFIPLNKPNILTVFIAWLNLDFGIETCFYDGMDGYVKVWLQLVFPLYIILLVAMVIVFSEHSRKFSRLISRQNPVATLATLILLSYTKLLRTIIDALAFATLTYPDGSHERVWLFDATVPYLKGKHIPLFVAAVLILTVGVLYTVILSFWQWIIRYSNICIFKWSKNTRLYSFMDVYHAPYNTKYRFWTGLLLFARILLCLISAQNFNGDTSVNILTTICIMGFLLMLKATDRIYRKIPVDVLESSFLFNIVIFSAATYHVEVTGGHQAVLAYTSLSIAFITFVVIVAYHSFQLLPRKRCTRLNIRSSAKSTTSIYNSIHHVHDTSSKINGNESTTAIAHKDRVARHFSASMLCSVTEIDGVPPINDTEPRPALSLEHSQRGNSGQSEALGHCHGNHSVPISNENDKTLSSGKETTPLLL